MRNENTNGSLFESPKFSVVKDHYFEVRSSYTSYRKSLLTTSNTNQEDISLKPELKDDNFKASLCILASYTLFSIVNLLGKIIGYYFPLVENSSTNLIRGIIVMIMCHLNFKREGVILTDELNKPRNKLFTLFLRCFTGAMSNFLLFESFKYMRISSSFTIFNTSPIFVTIISVLLLKAKLTIIDVGAFAVCFLSFCMITKPAFLFDNSGDDGDTPLGVFLSLSGALFSATAILCNRVIAKDFHYIMSLYGMGISFLIISLIVLPFTQYGLSTITPISFLCAVLLSVIFYYFLGLFVYGMNIGDPIKVLPITYIAIVLNLIYNSFIFGQPCDFMDILGSFLIIAVNVLKTLYQK